ncbi:uncharacterized protein LOC131953394 [Physella acuta]|uniref:uncharacterized protein LOC131953394 n=1 Tax=Physella acuta TaxID=109671 RepID=UPI0027DAC8C6|nr:uncharacterized protein LOC131953394 [Physella acuta]XP_059172544.1 uncharacterized protein LOC131953394 [Physella acuta]
MTAQNAGSECVVIEDIDLADDEPGPTRSVYRPSACAYESHWFEQPFVRPSEQVVDSSIPEKFLDIFKDLIWNKPHDRMVPGYGMTPKELASVSSDGRKGWLVSSHFYWLSRCINQQQDHTLFFVLDPGLKKVSLEKILNGKTAKDVKQIIFVMSVGRQDDGIVFLGNDKMPGDHWSVAIVDIVKEELSYCDTLGWPVPEKLEYCLSTYTSSFGLSHQKQLRVRMAHQPNSEQHECSPYCTNYPLQTCSDVCGVIAMICIAIAALDRDLFELLMKPIDKKLNLYLTDPTEYSSYLRHVLIYWLASNHIDINKIKLKSGFDPHVSIGTPKITLKRKYECTNNGDHNSTPKRIGKPNREVSLNNYILDAVDSDVSFDVILSDVFNIFGEEISEAKNKRLATNFSSFTLNNSIERDKQDAISTKSYVQELIDLGADNPIILFKPKGKEINNAGREDVMIALQTVYQKNMMLTYGSKCVCVEQSKKKETDTFNLLTVSVFVEGTDELPVAWLISSRIDKNVIDHFFKVLRVNVGNFQTEMFIGDTNGNFLRHWIRYFPKPHKKFYLAWEIQQLLQRRLEKVVSNTKVCFQIKNYLLFLFHITNVRAFKAYSQALFEFLKPYKEFLDYMKSSYFDESKDEFWASCYRHIPESKFVPFLQPFDQTLTMLGFYQKDKLSRSDILLHKLLQFGRFMESKLLVHTSQVHLQNALRDINSKHNDCMGNLDIFHSASGDEWFVRASEETNSFSVLDSGITNCECPLMCESCKICVHRYVCTCVEYLMKAASCKHIHFVHAHTQVNKIINN